MARVLTAFFLSSCLALGACGGKAKAPAPVYDLKLTGRSTGTAVAARGDTLDAIARRYALTIVDIIRMNQLPGHALMAGQRILLPPPRQYTVKPGDSVVSIAGMFDLQPMAIIHENGLVAPYALRAGQHLRLPHGDDRGAPVRVASLAPEQMPAHPAMAVDAAPLPPERPAQVQAASLGPQGGTGKFAHPVRGRIVSAYGPKNGGLYNDGINIAAPAGSPVHAAREGTVVYAGNGLDGYGNLVLVRHDDGYFTVYGHMADINVAKGVQVARGQRIGAVGASGKVSEPQLHFEIRKGTQSLDPQRYL